MMNRKGIIRPGLCLLLLLVFSGQAMAEEKSCDVKYISAEHVYLDAGSSSGLTPGLLVKVVRSEAIIARLEVVFTAKYSSSCKILSTEQEILPGDTAVYNAVEVSEAPVASKPTPGSSRTRPTIADTSRPSSRPGGRVSGSVAMQWDHSEENVERNLANDFVSVPFRVRVTDLGPGLEFRSRGSLRRISRSGYSGSTPDSEWRNRIQEVSLRREGRERAVHFAVGRIGTRFTASAGTFDGVSFNGKVIGNLRLGAFGGFTPDWGTMSFSTNNRLAGVSAGYKHRTESGNYFDLGLAGVGRYRGSEISREYLTFRTTWRNASGLQLSQSSELDFNRGWRLTENNESVELTSLAVNGRYKVTKDIAVNLGYDDRKPIKTWESRSLPDSLFQDAGRVGYRAGLTWRGNRGMNVYLWGSLRSREGDEKNTTSWNARFFVPRYTPAKLDLSVSVRGFGGPYLSGLAPTASIYRTIKGNLRLGVEGGYYVYSDIGDLPDRKNTWGKFVVSRDFGRIWSVHADYRQDWGDDIDGRRWFMELRRRF